MTPSATTAMVGHGFQDRHSARPWAATEDVLPWLAQAIGSMRLAATPSSRYF